MPTDIEHALEKTLVLVLSRDGGDRLARLLPALNVPPRLIVVLDQKGGDVSEAVCRKHGVHFHRLNPAHSRTQALNEGIALARAAAKTYLVLADDTVLPKTDVVRELLAEALSDPALGAAAPAQILPAEQNGRQVVAYRAQWNLRDLTFERDSRAPPQDTQRLEADFCEFAFALIRADAIDAVGPLDERYVSSPVMEADFGFRLGQAGYACAYLPQAQIQGPASGPPSTDKGRRSAALTPDEDLFRKKHLAYSVRHSNPNPDAVNSWSIINRNLHRYIDKYGLINRAAPHLIMSHPGSEPFEYLYTVWETSKIPHQWALHADKYKLYLAPSHWVVDVLTQGGFANVHYVPHGVETDIFHPWGAARRLSPQKTFLWFADNQHRKGLDVMLAAWQAFHAKRPDALLVIMGHNISKHAATEHGQAIKSGNFAIYRPEGAGYIVYEIVNGLSDEALAQIYRSVDFTVSTSRSEGFGFTIAESLACGVPAIFGDFGGAGEFAYPGALTVRGAPVAADYSDMGFDDVGTWWEPSMDHLIQRLEEAWAMPAEAYARLSEAGVQLVRQNFTWRRCIYRLRTALGAAGQGNPDAPTALTGPYLARVRQRAREAGRLRDAGQFFNALAAGWEERGIRFALRTAWATVTRRVGRTPASR